jgi:hypothetical protein
LVCVRLIHILKGELKVVILRNWKCALVLGLSGLASFIVCGVSAALVTSIYADGQISVSQIMLERARYESLASRHDMQRAQYMVTLLNNDGLTEKAGCPVGGPLYAVVQGVKVRVC